MDLQNLTAYCGKKAESGYSALQYLPTANLSTDYYPLIADGGAVVYEPSRQTGKSWLTLPFLAATDKAISTATTDNKYGVAYKNMVTTYLPTMTSQGIQELQKMKVARDFIVRYRDKQGSWWLLGDSEMPCFFDYEVEATGRVKVTWTSNSIRPIFRFIYT